ncbi:hypothetical protein F0P96_17210 [Hymenobacter busanensis]|uniref:Uncharacterized protein n=1 Tax=Hymenobacter busanensis TaxID=2607656 RepID=A0A7L4ZT33_9BACT|nr:hypothetical protein [Hymenobacter busanensis]KAA9327714.1 hypothetical protein F0P96_17210 [Hymenobacter busanensis]QHJ05945.1 hypothetical protein GUY19_01015 [Hymenobacter busanensis]
MQTDAPLSSPVQRQQAVAFVLRLAQGTRLEPLVPEQQLLAEFVAGELTLDELEVQLEQQAAD